MAYGRVNVGGDRSVKRKQNGIVSMSDLNTKNVSISNVDLTKAVLLFNYTNRGIRDLNPANSCIMGELSNNQIVFSRNSSTYETEIEWEVIEFENLKSLQTLKFKFDYLTDKKRIKINTVNKNKSIVIFSFKHSAGSSVTDFNIQCYLDTDDYLIAKAINSSYEIEVNAFIIEFN